MAVLILPRNRTSAPQQNAPIAGNFPAPYEVFLPAVSSNGLSGKLVLATQATFTVKATRGGTGINVSATGRKYTDEWPEGATNAAWLVVAYRDGSAAGTTQSLLRKNGSCLPVQEHSSSIVRLATWDSGGPVVASYGATSTFQNRTNVFAGALRGTAGKAWWNGANSVTWTMPTGTLSSTTDPLCIGDAEVGGETATAWTIIAVALWRDNVPTDAQMRAFSDNPWLLFAPQSRVNVNTVAAAGNTISVPAGSLTLTGFAPTIVQTANNVIAVPAGSLTLTGLAPTVLSGGGNTIAVPAGSLTLSGLAPTIVQTANNVIAVPAGSLTLQGYAPTVTGGVSTPDVVTTGGGGPSRRLPRNYWTIRGKTYLIEDKNVPDLVQAILKADRAAEKKLSVPVQKQVKQIRKALAEVKPTAQPTFQSLPAFDALWSELMKNQRHAEAERLRQIAYDMEVEADDAEIMELLRMMDES